jgi:hypothetical protein
MRWSFSPLSELATRFVTKWLTKTRRPARGRYGRPTLEVFERRHLLASLFPYQNAADHYDVNADGARNVMDVWLIDQELRAHGEHVLLPPNGPVQFYIDVNGDNMLSHADVDLWLRYDTGTLQEPAGSDVSSETDDGGTMSSMSCAPW